MSDLALAVRNAARRRWRSMAVVAMLACGCFLIVAVGANRLDPSATASQRSSGTGGFALVGRSVLPVYQDLNSPAGRDAYGLSQQEMARAEVLPLRVREGDDASCLNLNRAQVPRLLGVRPSELHKRGAFRFIKTVDVADPSAPWNLLSADFGPDVVPAIGDDATITWALGKKLGDTLDYIDDSGQPFHIRIVAVLGGSIFQGSLLVCEQAFVQRFGSAGGYREFLIDAPRDRADAVSASLERALERVGLEVSSAAERLAVFNTVQNTYLSIFQALGGLGMLLGTVAVGIVTTRNVLERRGELALMRAVGFTAGRLKWLVFLEHCGLLALGITCGTVAAVIAVLPALRSAAEVPYWSLAATLLAVAVSGAGWVLIATTLALRRPMLEALRNE